ncbi:MAG: prepilin peptidase [Novosphingobium sp.]|nr:prepilin peptidase [Novosphingobium sp.]
MIAYVALGLCLLLILTGAVSDIRTRRIPNLLVIALAVCAVAYTLSAANVAALGSAALHAVIVLVVGMGLFALRWIGGGDAKFYAACALAVPLAKAVTLLFWTSVAGLLLVIGMIVAGVLRRQSLSAARTMKVPYGVAVAFGAIATLLLPLARF